MNCSRLVWLAGMLGASWGCSGRYVVTSDTGNSPGDGGSPSASAGSASVAGDRNTVGGGPNAVGAGGAVSASGATPVAGAFSVAGQPPIGGAAGATSYCGDIPPTPPVALAAPLVVWNRVQSFLLGQLTPAPMLPSVTTRQWAGAVAQSLMKAYFSPNALPGLTRFMTNFWPGTKRGQRYASLFDGGYTIDSLLAPEFGGLLLDPALLSEPTIPDRGNYIAQHLLCVNLPPTPAGIPPFVPVPGNGVTRRTQYEAQLDSPACAACHRIIDPLGDALEHYASDGTFSNVDNGLPIDSSGSYTLVTSGNIMFTDVNDLAKQLSSTCEVAQCLAQQLLTEAQTAASVPMDPKVDPTLALGIASQLMTSGGDLNGLVLAVVESDGFLRAP